MLCEKLNLPLRGEKPEVADILHKFFKHSADTQKLKVAHRIMSCRTEVLGGHKNECNHCDHMDFSYNSCRDRHCPKCQYGKKIKWIKKRYEELLPVQYFHVVFTIPSDLNPIFLTNKRICYGLLFKAMSETLLEVAESKLKAKIGFTSILHTWGQTLTDHPHIHAVVPGGGLSLDGERWIKSKKDFFLPVRVLSTVFRGKLLNFLESSHKNLKFTAETKRHESFCGFKSLLIDAAKKDWVVYSKPSFLGPEQVIKYLGHYTHRIAISNNRIKAIDGNDVVFEYRDRADNSKVKEMRLSGNEFLNRFLNHTLPNKFVRIRHYGLLGKKNKKKNLTLCRNLLKARKIEHAKDELSPARLKSLADIDPEVCPECKAGRLIKIKINPGGPLRKWKNSE